MEAKSSFKKSCIYQIYPRSFKDTSGSGTGDLNGITKKIEYLANLGVEYLWITPFFRSPQNDNGYDVSDYISVDPAFGTMDDFKALIKKANEYNIGIMLDMVFNHTSTEHTWFQKALAGDPKYMDYYIFKDKPTNWVSKFGGNAWEYVEKLDKWYLHLFDVTQADLNWENKAVRDELKEVLRFWKKLGVKGFRYDVVNLISKPDIYEDDHAGDGRRFYTDGPRVHEYIKEMVQDADLEGMITVGEMSSTSVENCIRYTAPKEHELKMCFNFHHLKVDYKDEQKWVLADFDFMKLKNLFNTWQEKMQEADGWNALFWSNHDQPRISSRFREGETFHAEASTMLSTSIHMMRGTPYIYQGEEIGMTNADFKSIDDYADVESINYYNIMLEKGVTQKEALNILAHRSRDNARTPMQWDDSLYAGFSEGKPWIKVNDNKAFINVKNQLQDKDSILNYHKKLIELRKKHEVIAYGQYIPLLEENNKVLAYKRKYNNEEILVFSNFYKENVDIEFLFEGAYEVLISNYNDEKKYDTGMQLRGYETKVYIKK